ENAEPQIQATACGSATGEAVPTGLQLQPQYAFVEDFGGGWGSYTVIEGGDREMICTSQWGYNYSCYSTVPALGLASTSLQLASFAGQAVTVSVMIWNSGGGTLTERASV
ncbi:MAG: hypothetical protein RMJ29_08840, partial [Candidatus Bipolaricaulota bacterium]|nr:hypothetical protein [Candidatus Bipolaricaulota bacterium]